MTCASPSNNLKNTATMSQKDNVTLSLLSRAHSPDTANRIFTEKIQHRPLHLKPTEGFNKRAARRNSRQQKLQERRKKQQPGPLSAREKRALGIYTIPISQQKYTIYEPLHAMWLGYIHEVMGPGCLPISSGTAAKLCSADFHGAEVEVVRSRCVGRVGVRGIVVKDTRGTFEIVEKTDRLVVVPKEHTIFRFEVPPPPSTKVGEQQKDLVIAETVKDEETRPARNLVFELHGSQFLHRAADRANKKFKPHHLQDL